MKKKKLYFLLLILTMILNGMFAQSGALDSDYGNSEGIQKINFISGEEKMYLSATDSQDRTWIAGWTEGQDHKNIILTRIDKGGNYDESFAGTGFMALDLFNKEDEVPRGLATHNDNLYLCGLFVDNGKTHPFVVNFNKDGSINESFGKEGIFVTTDVDMEITDIALNDEGSIFLAGTIESNTIVLKILPDGSDFDKNFGYFGGTTVEREGTESSSIDIDEEGNIYVFGYVESGDIVKGMITSFTKNGAINTNFHPSGQVIFEWPSGEHLLIHDGIYHDEYDVLYVTGRTYDQSTGVMKAVVIALTKQGEIIPSFGDGGYFEIETDDNFTSLSTKIEYNTHGLFMAVSILINPGDVLSGVLHLDQLGGRISTFGDNGIATVNVIEDDLDQAGSLSLQSDDKIVLVGHADSPSIGVFGFAARFDYNFTSNIKELAFESEMTIYPNPSREVLTVSIQDNKLEKRKFSIKDLLGRTLVEGIIHGKMSKIDVRDLFPGQYVLKIEGQGPQLWTKI